MYQMLIFVYIVQTMMLCPAQLKCHYPTSGHYAPCQSMGSPSRKGPVLLNRIFGQSKCLGAL